MSICHGSSAICRNIIRSIFAIPTTPTPSSTSLTKVAANTIASKLRIQIQTRYLSDTAVEALKKNKDIGPMIYEIEKRKFPLKYTVHNYNKIIGSYVRNMKYSNQLQEHVEYTLRRMKEKGIEPSEHTYLLAILGMARQRHKMPYQESRMEKWFYEFLALQMKKPKPFNNLKTVLLAMSRQGHPNLKEMFLTIHQAYPYLDVECWNAALRGCMRAKTPGKAQQLFDIARKINKVDADSYMIMVDSYLHFKDHTSAKEIFVTMMNDKKYTADSRFYGTFIIYYTKSRPNRETFETIDKLWQAVLTTTQRDEKIPPAWIEASLRYYHKYGGLANAEQLFLDLKIRHQTLNKNCISLMYDIICKFSRRRQLRSAISLYYDMLAEGYPIDNTALLAIIKTLKKIDDLPTAESLIKLIMQFDVHTKIAPQCLKLIGRSSER